MEVAHRLGTGGKRCDRLSGVVFDDFKRIGGQAGDGVALPVGDRDAEVHQVGTAANDGSFLSWQLSADQKHCTSDDRGAHAR